MIKLIHGGNTLVSFQALQKIIPDLSDLSVSRLTGAGLELNRLKEVIETPSFTGARQVLIEDLSTNRSTTLIKDLKKYLADLNQDQVVVFYERKQLPPESSLLNLTKDIQVFPSPKGVNVFDWADAVGSRRLKEALNGWQNLLNSGEEAEYLFIMLVRQFRLLLLLSKGAKVKVPDFVRSKLQSQVKVWQDDDLVRVYQRLLEMDRLNKTGGSPLSVTVPGLISSVGKIVRR